MKQLTTLIFTLALSTLTFAGERAAPMSDQDWSAFEAKCQTNPQCAQDLGKLKGAMEQYEAELKAVCAKDSAACAQRMDKEAQEQRERFARCDDPATCIDTLNRDMEQHELKLEQSSWCAKRPSNCEQQRKARDERQAKGMHWCDNYKDSCAHALEQATLQAQQRAQAEAALRKQQEVARVKKAEAEKQTILSNLDQWLVQQAVCEGNDAAKCQAELNQRLAQSETNLETSYCKEGGAVCEALKQRRAAREQSRQTWCEAHADVCKNAQQGAAREHQALVDDAERVAKRCASDGAKCNATRQSAYEQLLASAAHCDGQSAQCRAEVEGNVVTRQMQLAKSPWCAKHADFCQQQEAALATRLEQHKTWCETHEAACSTAERARRDQEQADQAKEKAEQLAEWNDAVHEVAKATAASCAGQATTACLNSINTAVKSYAERSEKTWCNGNKRRVEHCEVIRNGKASMNGDWCAAATNHCEALVKASSSSQK